MKTYLDLFRSLSEELDPKRLQRKFLSALLEMQDVGRGSIWIKEGAGYKCVEALGEQSETIQGLTIGVGEPSIVGWVIENRQMTEEVGFLKMRVDQVERLKGHVIL